MLWFALRSPNGHGITAVFGTAREVVDVHAQHRQIVQRGGQVRVLAAEDTLLHLERFSI